MSRNDLKEKIANCRQVAARCVSEQAGREQPLQGACAQPPSVPSPVCSSVSAESCNGWMHLKHAMGATKQVIHCIMRDEGISHYKDSQLVGVLPPHVVHVRVAE